MGAQRTWSGARLKAIREEKGLTFERFARLLDTSTSNVMRWEKGKVTPTANMAAALADKLEVDLNDFYENGKEEAA